MPPEILILKKIKPKPRSRYQRQGADDLFEYQEGLWFTLEELEQEKRRPKGAGKLLANRSIRAWATTIAILFLLIGIGNISESAERLVVVILFFWIIA